MAKLLSKYKVELEKTGLTQLDVYRYPDHDEVRVKTPDGDVLLVKLPSHREAMSIEEFRDYVLKEVKKIKEAKKKR
ncbi:MAG: hypothetical protein N3F04_00985 [Candidatus Nezhaarchaeota archaeon]|nr:hypothetical protein [Candidatus Nezhaarchaeota archaeon]MCX8141351.1 hypothetical protein [Candidatus Nezhaarchaeota archaeon]MDW8049617.1 hypothetical protein [Nitrososphaerota archaeon]